MYIRNYENNIRKLGEALQNIKFMENSEYFVGNDGQIYWNGCFASLLYPIVSVGEFSMYGQSLDVEIYGTVLKTNNPVYSININ